MAKTIATISGIALRPGVSKNRRWYKAEHIAGAVTSAQERIAAGQAPMAMLTFHGADDATREIAASLTGMSLEEDGSARFKAGIPDTVAGRDIAALLDTADGKPPHLKGVSIRGYWTGKVRKETSPDGKNTVETADGLELDGVDFTKSPGVTGAQVDSFSWATGGARETTERVLITESVEDVVAFTEEATEATESAPAAPESIRETMALFLGERATEDVEEAGTPAMSKRGSGTQGSGRVWADPGYQRDGKQRYDITTKAVAKAAWSYVNQKAKAAKYTPAQLKRIKGRIKAALRKFGVSVSTEAAGWTFEPYQVTEAVAEYMGDPSKAGSWCVTACNGPVSLSMSCYSMDPADLKACLSAAAAAAASSLAALDPDMDGDVDVPSGGSGDTDDDGGAPGDPYGAPGTSNDGYQSAPPPEQPAVEDAPQDDPATDNEAAAEAAEGTPAAAGTEEQEDAGMATESTTEAGGTAPAGLTEADVTKAVSEALAADREARRARKAAKRAAAQPAVTATEATPAAATTEDADARTARLIAEALKAAGIAPAQPEAPVQETEDQKITRIVQQMVANGAAPVTRKGSDPAEGGTPAPGGDGTLNEHGLPSGWPNKPLHEFNPDEMKQYCAPVLDQMIFGGRTDRFGRPLSVLDVPS